MENKAARLAASGAHLRQEERSPATVTKYLRDAAHFEGYARGRPLSRGLLIAYKEHLFARYAPASVNSMLAAVNGYLTFLGCPELRVRQLRVQRRAFAAEERELGREEYLRLVAAARKGGEERTALIMQAICSTGIRVSELRYITVEAALAGAAEVNLKGKTRMVLLPRALQKALIRYARKRGITAGPVFLTKGGRPIHRSQVWRDMRALAARAGVEPSKVFPHNLRHLFAKVFYALSNDIARLADVLGHSSIDTTRIYLRTSGREHARLLERMNLVVDTA